MPEIVDGLIRCGMLSSIGWKVECLRMSIQAPKESRSLHAAFLYLKPFVTQGFDPRMWGV